MSTLTSTTVQRIQTLADELDKLGRAALPKAIEAGKLLRECKAGLAHGQWMPWLEENFEFSHKTAMNWIMVLEADEAGKLGTVTNLTEAYRIASKAARPAPSPSPRQPSAPVTIEAEIVEPSPAPQEDEPEPLIVDGTEDDEPPVKKERVKKWVPDDAERLWLLAKIDLDKILPSDLSRERIARKIIAYGERMLATQKHPRAK